MLSVSRVALGPGYVHPSSSLIAIGLSSLKSSQLTSNFVAVQMTKNRRTVSDSRPVSDDDSEESDENGKGKSSSPNLLAPSPRRP